MELLTERDDTPCIKYYTESGRDTIRFFFGDIHHFWDSIDKVRDKLGAVIFTPIRYREAYATIKPNSHKNFNDFINEVRNGTTCR